LQRNPHEPWRQFVSLVLLQVEHTREKDLGEDLIYQAPADLLKDLKLLKQSLLDIGAKKIAEDLIFPVERLVKCFGFHLARLDIRQNSEYHDKALEQILKVSFPQLPEYRTWTEEERVKFITEELISERPF